MVEFAKRQHPVVNLDEFEQRLRGTPPVASQDDNPLAELARLVGGDNQRAAADPYKSMFAARAVARAAPAAETRQMPPAWDQAYDNTRRADHAGLRGSLDADGQQALFDLQAPAPRNDAADSHLIEDFEMAYAPIPVRDSHNDDVNAFAHPGEPARGAEYADDETLRAGAAPVWQAGASGVNRAQKTATRRPAIIMASIAVVGLSAIAGTFALRANGAVGSKPIAVIKASDQPSKIAPRSPGGSVVANQDASILDKTTGGSTAADVAATVKAVSVDEQPIDLSLLPKPDKATLQTGAPVTTAVAPPPPIVQSPQPLTSTIAGMFGEPKRVKSIHILPNGSVATASETASAPVAGMSVEMPAAVPLPTPRPGFASLPVNLGSAAPPTPSAKPVAHKATVRAIALTKPEAATGAPEGANLPMQLEPVAKPPVSGRVKVAMAVPVAGAGGGFSVQLAAPHSEQEARDVSTRLQKRFAAALAGHVPAIVAGDNNGKAVFRVRVSNLSRGEANTLCGKLKASGGSCFVAGG